MKKRVLSLILVIAMMFTLAIPAAAATAFPDMPSDYSTSALEAAVANGLLSGSDGKLMPDATLTRAEMAAVINRAFGAKGEASLAAFSDVASGDWFYADMAKAVQMKTFNGSDGKLNPNDAITRQEAFAVLARALSLETGTAADLAAFSDGAKVAEWAVGTTAAMIKSGFVHGADGCINPAYYIIRKDFAVLMDNIVKNYIKTAGTVTTLAPGSVMISVPNVTLKGVTVKGDLIIGDGVGNGDITLDSVKVEGKTIVRGGGVNSFVVKGSSSLGTITVSKVDGNVRVSVEGDAKVEIVSIADGKDDVLIEGKVDKLEVTAETPVVVQNAQIAQVNVTAANADVKLGDGAKVENVKTEEKAEGAKVQVAKGATVTTVEAKAPATDIKVAEGAKVTNVTASAAAAGTKLDLAKGAEVKTVDTKAAATEIKVAEGAKVDTVTASKEAAGTKLDVAKGAEVKTVNAAAENTAISGEGRVENAKVTADNVKVDTAGTKTEVSEGVSGVTAGDKGIEAGTTTTTEGTTPPAPSGGGSDGGDSASVTVTGVTLYLNGSTEVNATLSSDKAEFDLSDLTTYTDTTRITGIKIITNSASKYTVDTYSIDTNTIKEMGTFLGFLGLNTASDVSLKKIRDISDRFTVTGKIANGGNLSVAFKVKASGYYALTNEGKTITAKLNTTYATTPIGSVKIIDRDPFELMLQKINDHGLSTEYKLEASKEGVADFEKTYNGWNAISTLTLEGFLTSIAGEHNTITTLGSLTGLTVTITYGTNTLTLIFA